MDASAAKVGTASGIQLAGQQHVDGRTTRPDPSINTPAWPFGSLRYCHTVPIPSVHWRLQQGA